MDSNDPQIQQTQQNSGTSIQVMPTVLGTSNGGQQIFLQQAINAANGQQQIQVLPIQTIGQGNGQQMLIVQPQVQPQPQILQLPDGQTFIYQPMIPDTSQQPQIVNINGNFFQIPAQQAQATANIQTSPAPQTQNQPTQQVVMMSTAPSTSNLQATTTKPDPQSSISNIITTTTNEAPSTSTSSPVQNESEEEPLYVNASKYRRVCMFLFHCIFMKKLNFYRTIQKNTEKTSSSSEIGSTRKNSKRTTKISLRIKASTCDE